MKVILAGAFFFLTTFCWGQAVIRVDRTEITIGDQIQATIETDLSGGREWVNADRIWPDTASAFEKVSGPQWDRTEISRVRATWTLAIFDTGWVQLPALPVIIQQDSRIDTFHTQDIPIRVLSVEPDSAGLRDIKGIHLEPFNPGYYTRYLPYVALALLLAMGLYVGLKRRKLTTVSKTPPPPPPLPHEWAQQMLQELEVQKLWQRGEIKEHYSILTSILREYLERRYGIHAMEQISDEIIHQLRILNISPDVLLDTEELLALSDLIKFAKADPGIDIHAVTISRVQDFVQATTPTYPEPVSATPEKEEDEAVG